MFLVAILISCFCLQSAIAVHFLELFGLSKDYQKLCFCKCGVSKAYLGNSRTGRLPKEATVFPHEYPWLAAINIKDHVVAGSLISDKHVLTSAYLLYGLTPDHITVTLGAHDRCSIGGSALNISVESIILHPGYSHTNLNNDLALIKLKHAVAFSQYITPICLPLFGARNAQQVTWTAGWSQSNGSCIPHVAVLPSLLSTSCFKDGDSKLATYEKGCLGPVGVKSPVCKNDVGSPVMTRWSPALPFRLIGVVSSSSCEDISSPLFTRVIDHVGWIYEYIRKDCLCY